MTLVRRLALAASLLLAPPALAQVAVVDPWVRGVVPAQKSTGAFMELRAAADTTLVGASSPAAKIVEIHQMKMDGGVMRMSAVDKLALPAGKAVKLEPGGYHVMLMGLVAPIKEGDTVAITLALKDKDGKPWSVDVKAPVRALAAAPAPKH
jgi:copper(I)-binding protein